MLNDTKVWVGILIVVTGLAYWVLSDKQNHPKSEQHHLIPSFHQDEGSIDHIDQVILSQGETQLVLTRTDNSWYLDGGFYAAVDPLYKLLRAIRTAEIHEIKTANPEKHAQLNLADNDLLVSLYQGNELLHSIYIGKQSASGLTFVRRQGEEQTYLVKGLSPVSVNINQWRLKTVLDIPAAEVSAVNLKPVDGEQIHMTRNTETGSWQLMDIPGGYQLNPDAYLDQLAGGLSRLDIDNAEPVESWLNEDQKLSEVPAQLSITYQLNSGDEIMIVVYHLNDAYYLTIEADQYPQYQGWVMTVAEYKFKALNRQLLEFIEPIKAQTIEDSNE